MNVFQILANHLMCFSKFSRGLYNKNKQDTASIHLSGMHGRVTPIRDGTNPILQTGAFQQKQCLDAGTNDKYSDRA